MIESATSNLTGGFVYKFFKGLRMKIIYYLILLMLVMSSCAKIERKVVTFNTEPQGAEITIEEKNFKTGEVFTTVIGESPVDYEVSKPKSTSFEEDDDRFPAPSGKPKEPKYIVLAKKDGYFAEKKSIVDFDTLFESGRFIVPLDKSPLWWATTESAAVNQWMNLIVSSDISDVDMWQRIVDAVTKRFPELKEYDFTSGYLVSAPKVKLYKTSRGPFLLRSKFIATVMDRDPLTYRLKLDSHWSNMEGVKWSEYPRVFKEDAEMISELMSRFQAY